MAILNNLIVHGRSRFLNGVNADSIHTDLIDANDGVFKTITTTTLDANTITTDMLKANNARVSQTLAVDGTISTNKWESASMANIGGNFYISPTGKADSGTITVTKTGSTTVNGVTVGTYTIVVGDTAFGVTSTSSTIWGTNSKVIFTGSISYPKMTGTDLTTTGKKYPLGSCNGTMTQVSTGTGTLTGFTITGVNSPALDIFFKEVGVTSVSSTACSGYEMQISVYQSYYSSALHPIGILLTSYGKEKKQYIDIYGGANTLGDSDSGFADPAVRIGQLDGLPNIVDGSTAEATKPTGWGIYTNNGFFKGKIVSNAGVIANFTINGSKLYSNGKSSYSAAATNGGIYIGDDYISFGDGTKTYFYKDGTGQVGPWALSTTYFRNGNIASATNTTVSGVYLGTDGLNISNGTAATTSYITKSAVNIGNKLTWNGTTLSVNGNITSTSGQIGPWFINANSISRNASGNAAGSYDTASNMYFGTSGISLGTTFKVTDAGILTATNAILKTVSLQDSSGNTRATVDANGLIVKDTSGNTTSIFGAGTATIGYTSGDKYNIDITGTAIDLRYNTNVLNRINSSGMVLYDGGGIADSNKIASFGETVIIGKTDNAHMVMSSSSLSSKKNNSTYFDVNINGSDMASEVFYKEIVYIGKAGSGTKSGTFGITEPIYENKVILRLYRQSARVGGNNPSILICRNEITLGTAAEITVYQDDQLDGNHISYNYDGDDTLTVTYGFSSASYYYWVEAYIKERTMAPIYSFGLNSLGEGANSFGIGENTIHNGDNSFVLGKNNIPDTEKYVVIIGNGVTNAPSNALTVDWAGNVNAAGSYYGVTPWAHYSAGAPTLKSVSNRTYYWVTSFSGYVVNVRTNDTDVFDKVNAGLRVKRDGIYLVSLWIHFNGTSGDRLYARVARCVGGDISNIGGATINSYVTLDPTWAEISYEQVVVCLANDTLCPQVARESTSSGGSFRFGNMLMNVTYLGSDTKIVDL